MASYNNHEDEDQVPVLLPIKKKADALVPTPSDKNSKSNDNLNSIIKDSIEKTPVSAIGKDNDKNFGQFKRPPTKEAGEETEKKGKDKKASQKKDNQFNKLENEKTKENEKMKALIAQMLNSMTIKNSATEELYPVSNEIIEELLASIQDEITELANEAERKSANQNNLHAEKELEVIRRQINHCTLIKQLYYEKMNYRNKIQALEEEIINLRSENRDLKLKVSRGIESIENYKHNLPCDREKELIEKLSICTQELTQEREMRQNLEKNIQSIIMNFKKLYDEADAARKIVTQKLKEVEEREKKLKKLKESEKGTNEGSKSPRKVASFEINEDRKQSDSKSFMQQSYDNQASSRKQQEGDSIGHSRQNYRPKPLLILSHLGEEKEKGKEKGKEKEKSQERREREREKKEKKVSEAQQNEAMSLEEKIKKMRNNQLNFKKNFAV